jgi:hypothetical protein
MVEIRNAGDPAVLWGALRIQEPEVTEQERSPSREHLRMGIVRRQRRS